MNVGVVTPLLLWLLSVDLPSPRKLGDTSTDDVDSTVVSYLAEQTAQAALWPDDEELRE